MKLTKSGLVISIERRVAIFLFAKVKYRGGIQERSVFESSLQLAPNAKERFMNTMPNDLTVSKCHRHPWMVIFISQALEQFAECQVSNHIECSIIISPHQVSFTLSISMNCFVQMFDK